MSITIYNYSLVIFMWKQEPIICCLFNPWIICEYSFPLSYYDSMRSNLFQNVNW